MRDGVVVLVQNPRQVHPPEMAVFLDSASPYDPSRAAEESDRLRATLEGFGLRVLEPAQVLRTLDRATLVSLATGAVSAEHEERCLRARQTLSGWAVDDLAELVLRQPRLLLDHDPELAAISPDSSYESYAITPLFGLMFPRDHYVDLDGWLAIGRLRREDRQREMALMRAVVERLRGAGADAVIEAPEHLEGGDVVTYGSVALVSVGFRTTPAAAERLWDALRRRFTRVVCLRDRLRRPAEFHLDHWLALGPALALASAGRLEQPGCRTLEGGADPLAAGKPDLTLRQALQSLDLRVVPLDPDDLAAFTANALFLPGSSAAVLPDSVSPVVRRRLEGLGLQTVTVPFGEHHRQHGSIHCATNFLTL